MNSDQPNSSKCVLDKLETFLLNMCLLFPFQSLAFSLTIICLIETLSEGSADDLSEKCKGKLQRTFVAASDAAEAKTKRCKYILS
ncbi:partner of xrn-2 protein 1-like isoform X1, partial [Aphis craccivora]